MELMEARIQELIDANGLSHIAGELLQSLKYSIRLKTRAVTEDQLAVGASKIGGTPDLPPDMQWPEWSNGPLSFICQIHLPDITPYDRDYLLPHTGMLYFFYHYNDDADVYTFMEERPDGPPPWRVIYVESDVFQLVRTPAPAILSSEVELFAPCAIDFSTELTIPDFDSPWLEKLGLTYDTLKPDAPPERKEEFAKFLRLCEQINSLYGDPNLIHRSLGHPDTVQRDIMIECQTYANGQDLDEYLSQSTGMAHINEGARDWVLLLQIDSDDDANMMWGDVGRIYYCIRREDLLKRNFNRAWFAFQCR